MTLNLVAPFYFYFHVTVNDDQLYMWVYCFPLIYLIFGFFLFHSIRLLLYFEFEIWNLFLLLVSKKPSLHFLFGKNFEGATRIVDQRGVKRISGYPSGRFIFQVSFLHQSCFASTLVFLLFVFCCCLLLSSSFNRLRIHFNWIV